jgi:pimeloyl-ACP methyl ester carboxylesterase
VSRLAAPDGTSLAYSEVGAGPRLVCVPGGPGRASAYLEDLGGLSGERTLVRLDNRATGASEVPADPSTLRFDRLAEDVEALRDHLGEERIDLLGHSAGAIVAQAYAAAHPDRLRSLLLVTPSDHLQGGTRSDVPRIRASRSTEGWYGEAAEAQDALADAAPAQRQALVRATRPFLYGRWDERTQAHAASADRQSSRRAELGFGAGGEEVDVAGLLAALGRLDVPVLVVGAERDAATGLTSVDAVAACFPRAETAVVPRAGHFPWVDEPDAFRAVVSDFLARVPGPA